MKPDGTSTADPSASVDTALFEETGTGKFVPRSILADLEPDPIMDVFCGSQADLFDFGNCVYALEGTGGNFAAGYYTQGKQIIDTLMDKVRKLAEASDTL